VKFGETAVVPATGTVAGGNTGGPAHPASAGPNTVNVTVPVGAGAPAAGVNVAVSWNDPPTVIGVAGAITVAIAGVALFTVTGSAPHALDTAALLASPL
jgi:hypothetical protein